MSSSSSVVVVVVATTCGGGVAVVVCTAVVVWLLGVAQPANATVPASKATRRKRDWVSVIVCFLKVRAVAVPSEISTTPVAKDDQRMVVVSLDLCDAVVSPAGETVVPLDMVLLLSVTTPPTDDVRWLELDVDVSDGIGATGVVVDCVVVELDDELCANATPVINVTAIVAANRVLII